MIEFINEKSLKEAREAEDVPKEILKGIESINDSSLALAEAVATNYETNLERAEKNDEVLATIYETILGGQEK
ncbi:hypothetical protein PEPTYR26121_01640 [Peptoniphilus tyrrelliae]|nr:hypothetical protein PEPTYR26121_01640 [Peptoniphilus tyrrelliae]